MSAPADVAQLVSNKPGSSSGLLLKPGPIVALQPRLTEEEMREALRVYSPALVKEIYEATIRQLQSETAKQGRLDAKASSLLTAIGLALTVAFTFGSGFLLTQADKLPALKGREAAAVGVVFWLTVAIGIIAGVHAIVALLVRDDYRMINEQALFNKESLREYDQRDEGDEGITEYRKYLIPHLWGISQQHCLVHEGKARIVKRGQIFFALFLVGLMLIVAGVSWIVVNQRTGVGGSGATSTAEAPTN